MKTRLVKTREPNVSEQKRGAEVVFLRRDKDGVQYKILAAKCYESWEQWGAETDILWDNMPAVEKWRRGLGK
jgi:hypothetical protein